ncbi:hypothetical protein JCM1393_05930 [Clostridium carnis]
MSRYFNGQEVELLAPAGTFEIFKDIIKSGADAVYFGGKKLNMRMHRKDYNLTNEEIIEAISIAHSLGKKVYITVNNLLSNDEVEEAKEYLKFLETAKPDALIVQDFSILELIKDLNLNLTVHSSVMMNVHNLETINALKELGVTRVVTSRDIDLNLIKLLHSKTDMEFEYFAHGDMCVAHGAQCLYSGMLFGKSGSRGRCMKPCRWHYEMKKDGLVYKTTYPMAVKDMYMYEHLPEMIEAGVVSFKIEGRMRDSDYLVKLINQYSNAIDRYIDDPINYDRKLHSEDIFENRKRDLSTAYAFGNPGLKNINTRYEGTGKFYSTGKVFSTPIEEIEISYDRINLVKDDLASNSTITSSPKLAIKVNSTEQALAAIEEGVDAVYLSGDVFIPNKPFGKNDILNITKNKKNTKVYLGLPRMMFEEDFSKYTHLLKSTNLNIDGILATNLGAAYRFKSLGLPIIGDYSMNIYNSEATSFYKKQGISMATISAETPAKDTKAAIEKSKIPVEVIVHGSPVVMFMSHDLYENTEVLEASGKEDNKYVKNEVLVLVDEKGTEHPIYKDNTGKNHMMLAKELCYLPFLKEFSSLGVESFRIEGCHYDIDTLRVVVKAYKEALNNLDKCDEIFNNLKYKNAGFTLGAFQFN